MANPAEIQKPDETIPSSDNIHLPYTPPPHSISQAEALLYVINEFGGESKEWATSAISEANNGHIDENNEIWFKDIRNGQEIKMRDSVNDEGKYNDLLNNLLTSSISFDKFINKEKNKLEVVATIKDGAVIKTFTYSRSLKKEDMIKEPTQGILDDYDFLDDDFDDPISNIKPQTVLSLNNLFGSKKQEQAEHAETSFWDKILEGLSVPPPQQEEPVEQKAGLLSLFGFESPSQELIADDNNSLHKPDEQTTKPSDYFFPSFGFTSVAKTTEHAPVPLKASTQIAPRKMASQAERLDSGIKLEITKPLPSHEEQSKDSGDPKAVKSEPTVTLALKQPIKAEKVKGTRAVEATKASKLILKATETPKQAGTQITLDHKPAIEPTRDIEDSIIEDLDLEDTTGISIKTTPAHKAKETKGQSKIEIKEIRPEAALRSKIVSKKPDTLKPVINTPARREVSKDKITTVKQSVPKPEKAPAKTEVRATKPEAIIVKQEKVREQALPKTVTKPTEVKIAVAKPISDKKESAIRGQKSQTEDRVPAKAPVKTEVMRKDDSEKTIMENLIEPTIKIDEIAIPAETEEIIRELPKQVEQTQILTAKDKQEGTAKAETSTQPTIKAAKTTAIIKEASAQVPAKVISVKQENQRVVTEKTMIAPEIQIIEEKQTVETSNTNNNKGIRSENAKRETQSPDIKVSLEPQAELQDPDEPEAQAVMPILEKPQIKSVLTELKALEAVLPAPEITTNHMALQREQTTIVEQDNYSSEITQEIVKPQQNKASEKNMINKPSIQIRNFVQREKAYITQNRTVEFQVREQKEVNNAVQELKVLQKLTPKPKEISVRLEKAPHQETLAKDRPIAAPEVKPVAQEKPAINNLEVIYRTIVRLSPLRESNKALADLAVDTGMAKYQDLSESKLKNKYGIQMDEKKPLPKFNTLPKAVRHQKPSPTPLPDYNFDDEIELATSQASGITLAA